SSLHGYAFGGWRHLHASRGLSVERRAARVAAPASLHAPATPRARVGPQHPHLTLPWVPSSRPSPLTRCARRPPARGVAQHVPGGSTITQQVARQFFLSSEYSYTRKLAEMLLAMKMERELGKDEIFQLYLNKSFFGNRSYGIAAAAEFYFGKELDQLDLDEIAALASIPKFPSSGNPVANPERARIRRDYVLQRMRELGFITEAEEKAARATPMHATPHDIPVEVDAPYVAEMVRQDMVARYGEDVLTRGYHVITTIDPVMQQAAQRAVQDGLIDYDHRHGWRKERERRFELGENEDAATAGARL